MGLRINQNIAAQNAYRNLSVTDGQMAKSLEKLSSGFRINRAADDAAGLSISEGLRSQVGGMKVAVRNTQDGVSVAQTAEGSMNEVTSILQRMRDLSVQASNSGATDANAAGAANKEMTQLNAELDRIGGSAAFGAAKLLDGSFGSTAEVKSTAAVANTAGAATVAPTLIGSGDSATTLVLSKVAGKDFSTATPPNITITLPKVPAGSSPSDVAKAANTAIEAALKAADPTLQGNEITLTSSVNKAGDTTYRLGGAGDFTLDASSVTTDLGGFATGAGTAVAGGNKGQFQVGANANQKISISIGGVDSQSLATASLDLTKDPDSAITTIDKALQSISDQRASLGAVQNRFEHTINNLNVAVENLSASESRIRDTDMAQEMVAFTRSQILTQAGTSMLSQANQSAQNVLSLLR
jgi:flagellin